MAIYLHNLFTVTKVIDKEFTWYYVFLLINRTKDMHKFYGDPKRCNQITILDQTFKWIDLICLLEKNQRHYTSTRLKPLKSKKLLQKEIIVHRPKIAKVSLTNLA